MKFSKAYIYLLPLLALITCIERNNPWDPIFGCPEAIKEEYRKEQLPQFIELSNRLDSLFKSLSIYDSAYKNRYEKNDSVADKNSSLFIAEQKNSRYNDSISMFNKEIDDCRFYTQKTMYLLYDTFQVFLPDSIEKIQDQMRKDSALIISLIDAGNKRCQSEGIYSLQFSDSSILPYINFSKIFDSVAGAFSKEMIRIADSNISIKMHNDTLIAINREIKKYNDSLVPLREMCGKDIVKTSDSLRSALEHIKPGDSLYLDSGKFVLPIRLNQEGDTVNPIVIMGSKYSRTYIDFADAFLTNSRNIRFYNLTFQNGLNKSGIKMEANCENILFENCIFQNNASYGIEAIQSSFEMKNCMVINNGAGGIRITGESDLSSFNKSAGFLYANNVIIAHNKYNGISAISAELYMYNATISDNALDGVHLEVPDRSATFSKSIFSFNGQNGINREPIAVNITKLIIDNCNFYSNVNKAILADSVYLRTTSAPDTTDPGFVDRASNNYHITSESLIDRGIGFQYDTTKTYWRF